MKGDRLGAAIDAILSLEPLVEPITLHPLAISEANFRARVGEVIETLVLDQYANREAFHILSAHAEDLAAIATNVMKAKGLVK